MHQLGNIKSLGRFYLLSLVLFPEADMLVIADIFLLFISLLTKAVLTIKQAKWVKELSFYSIFSPMQFFAVISRGKKKKIGLLLGIFYAILHMLALYLASYRELFMNKYQVLLGTVALSATLLAGCANTDQLSADVQGLTTKVDQLAGEVSALRSEQTKLATDVQEAKSEAIRANQRLDNMATHYKK